MKKSVVLLSAFVCANTGIYAQSIGSIVKDQTQGVSYTIKEKVLEKSEDMFKTTVTVPDNITYSKKGNSSPYIKYSGAENITIVSSIVSREINTAVVDAAAFDGSSNPVIQPFTAEGTESQETFYTSEPKAFRYDDADPSGYTTYAHYFLQANKNNDKSKTFDINLGFLKGTASYMTYHELDSIHGKKDFTVYINDTKQTNFAASIKGRENDICMMVLVGSLGTVTSFVVTTFNMTEKYNSETEYSTTCTPTSIPTGINWNGKDVTVTECVEHVETGAFSTAGMAIRHINLNSNYYEPVLAVAPQGSKRYGLYVGNNTFSKILSGSNNMTGITNWLNDFDKSTSTAGLCYVDFSGAVAKNRNYGAMVKCANTNANCLYIFPKGTQVSGENVIIDSICNNLVLTRDASAPFYCPSEFTAKNMSMTNVPFSSSKYVAFCFPFRISTPITLRNGTDTKTGNMTDLLRACEFSSYEDGKINYSIIKANEISNPTGGFHGNKPCLINLREPGEYTEFSANDVTVLATDGETFLSSEENGGWRMIGNYQSVIFSDEQYSYYGFSNNQLKQAVANKATLKPFSAAMVQLDANSVIDANAKLRVTSEDDDLVDEVAEVEEALSLSVETGSGCITVSGSATVKIASVSGSAIFSGKLSGTETFDVPSGVYIVNGKKYIVR